MILDNVVDCDPVQQGSICAGHSGNGQDVTVYQSVTRDGDDGRITNSDCTDGLCRSGRTGDVEFAVLCELC